MSNETAGEHYTPREAIRLMVNLLFAEVADALSGQRPVGTIFWFEQRRPMVMESSEARVVALNNDFDQYRIVLEKIADDMIVDRHEANGMLFDAYFSKPEVR